MRREAPFYLYLMGGKATCVFHIVPDASTRQSLEDCDSLLTLDTLASVLVGVAVENTR